MEKKTIENMDYNYELYTQIENLKIIREWINDIDILLRKMEKMDINNIQKQIDETYQKGVEDGRNETWEAARKIVLYRDEGGTSILDLTEIFGCFTIQQVFRRYTVSETLEKLKAYEEKQKADDEIKVGDEMRQVTNSGAPTGLVCTVTAFDGEKMCGFSQDGLLVVCSSQVNRWWKKTGRHFGIDKILEEMRS